MILYNSNYIRDSYSNTNYIKDSKKIAILA